MKSAIVGDDKVWFIAHNGVDVLHYGIASALQEITTGQPSLCVYTDEAIYEERLGYLARELGVELDDEPDQQ